MRDVPIIILGRQGVFPVTCKLYKIICLRKLLFAPYPLDLQVSIKHKNFSSFVENIQRSFLIASRGLLKIST
jgi:hypothetical protein